MGLNLNSKIVTDGLVFALDAANPKGINPSGCAGYNNAPQLVKNLVSPSETISATSNLKLGNLSYFTAFAIDYPESSYGGAAAGRNGITPGYNVTSGSKDFSYGRALNFWVYDSATSTTVLAQVYDTYASSSEVDRFVTEYYQARTNYKGSRYTFSVAGSHRDSNHSEAQYTALRDMGAPSNVNSIINFSAPEWILVGRPGIGADNGAWSYQNYSTNADQVAHLNFGVPFQGNSSNYLSFDGSNDYITIPYNSKYNFNSGQTIIIWMKNQSPSSARRNPYNQAYAGGGTITHENDGVFSYYWGTGGGDNSPYSGFVSSFSLVVGETAMICLTRDASTVSWYKNGELGNSTSNPYGAGVVTGTNNITIGNGYTSMFGGSIYAVQLYTRGLTAAEVKQNFNALRGRVGL